MNDDIRLRADIIRSPAVQLIAYLVQNGPGLKGMRIRQDGHVEFRANALHHFDEALRKNPLDECQHQCRGEALPLTFLCRSDGNDDVIVTVIMIQFFRTQLAGQDTVQSSNRGEHIAVGLHQQALLFKLLFEEPLRR